MLSEINYIGERMSALPEHTSRRDVYITDSNFGMYKPDIIYAEAFRKSRDKCGWPNYVKATTGKNQTERILNVAKELDGAITLAGSVQSLDSEVLDNVQRKNIKASSLLNMALEADNIGANSYSDVILGLPGDSLDRHVSTVSQLVDAGFNYLALYQLRLQNDCEMATKAYREKFALKGRFRALTRSYGSYKYKEKYLNLAEIEEVCVEGINLPFSDYIKAREYDLIVAIFYYDKVFDGILKLLKLNNIPYSHWINGLRKHCRDRPALGAHIDDFIEATKAELFDKEDQLVEFSDSREIIEQYLSGDLGANLLGKYRILAVTDFFDDVCHLATIAAKSGFL